GELLADLWQQPIDGLQVGRDRGRGRFAAALEPGQREQGNSCQSGVLGGSQGRVHSKIAEPYSATGAGRRGQ
ncbi:MAG: hypothetical protein ACI8QC_002515, partial [Planctomycetota bacterium]